MDQPKFTFLHPLEHHLPAGSVAVSSSHAWLPRSLNPGFDAAVTIGILEATPPMPSYTLKVNGQTRKVEAAADTPLLWVLRDHLELVGTKYGCGIGACGACTVHINGAPMRSCQLLVSTVVGAAITTIEGLDPTGSHPLQKAWCEHDVPQCGYCQAGQIMTAAAFLKNNPSPTDEDISGAMAGNLCRCGTYARIQAAVKDAAAELRQGGGK